MLRDVRTEFVKTIVAGYDPKMGFDTKIPVVVEGPFKKSEVHASKYQTLGGNHARAALEELIKSKTIDENHKVTVKVYRYVYHPASSIPIQYLCL